MARVGRLCDFIVKTVNFLPLLGGEVRETIRFDTLHIFAISVEHPSSRVSLITSSYLHLVSSFSGLLLSYEAANLREKLFPKVLFYFCHELPNI